MAKFGKSVLIGATIGVAAAYFLNTRKGKEVKDKANEFITDYKDNTEEYNQLALAKANSYKDMAVEAFNDYKSKYENGDLTVDDLVEQVKEKATLVKDVAVNTLNQVTSDTDVKEKVVKSTAEVDDIVINYDNQDL